MNILFISPYVPSLVRVRSYNLIRSLTKNGHRVTVMTVSNGNTDDIQNLENHCHKVYAYDLPTWRSLINAAAALPMGIPLQANYSWQLDLANDSVEFLDGRDGDLSFDIVHIEHLRGARFGLNISESLAGSTNRVPIVWDSVDCISYLFDQTARSAESIVSRLVARFELGRTRRFEGYLGSQFDQVLITSKTDKQALLSLSSDDASMSEIAIIPNGVNLGYFKPGDGVPREKDTLVVSGKMSYHANVTMVLHLVEAIMPLVWARNPGVKLWIVGKDPGKEILSLAENPVITVTGTVDDIRPYLQTATVAVTPTCYGAGSQLKVLEAMACGTPVVSSSRAVSALDAQPGRDLLVADEPGEFANHILTLLDDQEEQHRIGEAGLKYVVEKHNWDQIALQLERIYEEVGGFYAWGAEPGARNIPNWGAMTRDDVVLCVYSNTYHYLSRVLDTFDNEHCAEAVWGRNACLQKE